MQFFQLAVAALASASAVYAMPAWGTDTKAAEKRDNPDKGVRSYFATKHHMVKYMFPF